MYGVVFSSRHGSLGPGFLQTANALALLPHKHQVGLPGSAGFVPCTAAVSPLAPPEPAFGGGQCNFEVEARTTRKPYSLLVSRAGSGFAGVVGKRYGRQTPGKSLIGDMFTGRYPMDRQDAMTWRDALCSRDSAKWLTNEGIPRQCDAP